MNNSNPGSRTGSMGSLLDDSGPLLDKTETTATNDSTLKNHSKSTRVNSNMYIPVRRSHKPVEDIVLLPGTEQFIRWSTVSGNDSGPNLNSPVPMQYSTQYGSHYERVVNRKSHRSSHRNSHRSSRRSKHGPGSSRQIDSPKYHPEEVAQQNTPTYHTQVAPGHVISSLEIQVPDMVPTEVLTSPTGDFSEEVFNNKPVTAHSDSNIFFPQFDHAGHPTNRSSRYWDPKIKKMVLGDIFTPTARSRESKPYLWKKIRGSSMPSLALQNIQSASYCANCQLTTCPNCCQVLQTPVRSSSHEVFGSVSNTPNAHSFRPFLQPSHSPANFKSKSNLTLTQPGVRHRHRHSSLLDFDRRSYASFAQDSSQNDVFTRDYRDLPKNVDFLEIEYIVPEDMDIGSQLSGDKLHTITKLAKDVMAKTDKVDDMARMMKEDLDRRLDPSWHVIVGADSYGSHLASLPGALANFQIDKWAFLVWQT